MQKSKANSDLGSGLAERSTKRRGFTVCNGAASSSKLVFDKSPRRTTRPNLRQKESEIRDMREEGLETQL
jgi:hypothetical protein